MPQGIEVGDATLRFLGDTTDLDMAFAKVEGTPGRLRPAEQEIQAMADDWTFMGFSGKKAGEDITMATEEIALGAKKAEFSMREAKGELALLGEETGVHLPRHVRAFVAELPGVGAALEAAFSATAALILIQVLIEGTKKLTEFISETFIYTEAMKKSEEVTKEMNKELVKQADELKKINKEMELFGLTGSKKTAVALKDLNEEIEKNAKELRAARDMIWAYNNEIGDHTPEQVDKAKASLVTLTMTAKTQQAELALLTKQFDREMTDEIVGAEEKRIAVRKKMGELAIEIAYQQNRAVLAAHKGSFILEVANDRQQAEMLYQNERKSLEAQLELTKFAGEKEKEQHAAIQAQIEVLDRVHGLKQIKAAADLQVKLRELRGTVEATRSELTNIITEPEIQKFEKLQATAAALGVTLSGELKFKADAAHQALNSLIKDGVLGNYQLAQAKLAVVQADLKLAHATDSSTTALKKEEAQLKKLIADEQEHSKVVEKSALAVGKAIGAEAFAFGQGVVTIGQAMRDLSSVVIKEIAKQAEVKGADALAEGFSMAATGQPGAGLKFAAAAGWFALAGGISMAAGAVAGSGATPGSAANPVNTTSSAGASSGGAMQPRALGGTNVQSFANAGLITRPTMALLGDRPNSKGEVAFDLGDERAKQHIREAMGGGGDGITINFPRGAMVSPDNLGKVVKQINRRVKKGQSSLTSSNTHRVTRRSV